MDDGLMVCESWELTRPTIPPRSRLFHLEPIGVGTPDVESLTGYVTRLAQAHGVSTRALVVGEILPLMGRPYLLAPMNRGQSSFWQRETQALNGTGTLARDLVRILETLTLRRDLRFLTVLTWTEVLPHRELLHRRRAWCPACYEEWQQTGQVVYDPLLWTLRPITACLRHRRRLQMACPYPDCRRPSPLLTSWSRPGYCSWCERWLGVSSAACPTDDETLTKDELRSLAWLMQAVGELLEAAPGLSVPPTRERLTRAILACVEQRPHGNVTTLAGELGLNLVTLQHWRCGQTRPSFDFLLWMCNRLGTTPLRFLVNDTATASPNSDLALIELPRGPVAIRRPINNDEVRRALEAALVGDEEPPPTMREVARRLGHAHGSLHHIFPDLCRAIAARHRAYQMQSTALKRQRLCAEIREATFEIHGLGRYPSAHRIAPLLSRPSILRDAEARAVWKNALRELGWQR